MYTTNNSAFPGAICALVIMALVVLGCGGFLGSEDVKIKNLTIPTIDPNEPFPALSTDGIDALIADVPELAKHREAVMAAERDAIKGALDDLRSKSKASNGPRTAVEITQVMPERNDSRAVALFSWPFKLTPVAMAAEFDMSSLGSLQQVIIGHNIGLFTNEGTANASDGTGSKTITMKDEKTGEVHATATVSVDTAGGVYTTEIATKVSMPLLGLDANSKVSLKGDPCPDPDGKVDLTVKHGSKARARKGGSASYDKNIEARIMATVGDDANLASTDFDLKQATHSSGSGQQVDVITSQSGNATGEAYSTVKLNDVKIDRGSQFVSPADQQSSEVGLKNALYLAIGALESARSRWQGGGCVKIVANSPGTVEPSSTTSIPVTVRHKWDGSEVPSKLDVVLKGEKSVSPTSIAKTAGTLTYVAPGEKNKNSTIGLTATSRRGRATLDLSASTGGNAYRVNGVSNNVSFTGAKICLDHGFSLDATFPGGTGHVFFRGDGTMGVDGGGGGCKMLGEGNYTLVFGDDGSGTLKWTTTDKLTCPAGFSNTKTSSFTVTLQPAPDLSCP
jgi:hypothetical protein